MSDIEYQADNSKATFYYSAEDRIDFRELIKILAGEFKIRVEMRQISLRQEAGRLGGIGVCGRELCCSTWLVDFKNVSTSAARYQNLSLNPGKLSGQCGRLKCCLNYELDTYMDAIKDIPAVERPLMTEVGPAKLQKTDIFRKLMWFSYNNDNDWHSITCDRVKEILELNAKNIKVFNLKVNQSTDIEDLAAKSTRELELLDKKFSNKKKKPKNRERNDQGTPGAQVKASPPTPKQQPLPQVAKQEGPRPAGEFKKKKNKNRNKNRNAQAGGQPQAGPPQAGQPNPQNPAREQRPNPPREPRPTPPQGEAKPVTKAPEQNQEAKKKFPPRRNQGPNPNNSGNEQG